MAQVLCSLSVFTFSTIRVNAFLAGFACPCMVAAVLCVHLYLIQPSVQHGYFVQNLFVGRPWLVGGQMSIYNPATSSDPPPDKAQICARDGEWEMVGQILIYNPATSRDHRPDTFSVSDSDRWPGWLQPHLPSALFTMCNSQQCANVQLSHRS